MTALTTEIERKIKKHFPLDRRDKDIDSFVSCLRVHGMVGNENEKEVEFYGYLIGLMRGDKRHKAFNYYVTNFFTLSVGVLQCKLPDFTPVQQLTSYIMFTLAKRNEMKKVLLAQEAPPKDWKPMEQHIVWYKLVMIMLVNKGYAQEESIKTRVHDTIGILLAEKGVYYCNELMYKMFHETKGAYLDDPKLDPQEVLVDWILSKENIVEILTEIIEKYD